MEKNVITDGSITEVLKGLKISQKATFNIVRLFSVRTTCSSLGLIMERRFSTKINRENGTITVTRLK